MRILSIDPGQATGVVFVDTEKNSFHSIVVRLWTNLDRIILKVQPEVIVMESFRLYPHMARTMIGNDFPSSQVIGVVKYLAGLQNIPVHLQPANVIKYVPSNPRISGEHMQDAYKHLMRFRRLKGV